MNSAPGFRSVGICIITILFAGFVAASLAAAPDSPATTAPAVYAGQVLGPDGKPVAGASVLLYDQMRSPLGGSPSIPPVEKTSTDAAGRFQLRSPPVYFTLVVQADSYGILALSSEDTTFLEVNLQPPSSLRAHITDTSGRPLAGVLVGLAWIYSPNNAWGAIPEELSQRLAQTTDDSGACIFTGLPERSDITLRVMDPRYEDTTGRAQSAGLGIADAPPIRVIKGGMIEGQLTRADTGAPVPNVRITDHISYSSEPVSTTSRTGTAETDSEGKFRLSQLRSGVRTLAASLDPPLNAELTPTNCAPVELAEGQSLSGVNLQLVKGAPIHGTATDENSAKPIAGGTITVGTALSQGRSTVGTTVTGPDGTYAIMVEPGEYTLRISNLASQGYLLPDPNGRQVIAKLGEDAKLDFTCPPNPNLAVKGRLLDAQGQPIAGAIITATPPGIGGGSFSSEDRFVQYLEESGGSATTDADGKFAIPFVTDRATLSIRKDDLRLSAPVTIDAGHRDLTLTALKSASGSLTVRVKDDGSRPVVGITVTVFAGGMRAFRGDGQKSGVTGPDGTFRVADLPTDVNYYVNASGDGYSRPSTSIVKVQADQETALAMTVSHADSFIAGTVVDANNKPIGGATILASAQSATTGPDGRFRIENIAAGATVTVDVLVDDVQGDPNGTRIQAGTSDAVITFDRNASR